MTGLAMLPLLFAMQMLPQSATPTEQANAPAEQGSLPAGTPLWVRSDRDVPLHIGQVLEGTLMYPVYADNRLRFPAGTVIEGSIVGLEADRPHRLQARLRGDFTPFSHPVVQFQAFRLPDGTRLTIPAGPATDGAPVLRLTPPPPSRGGFLRQQFAMGVGMAKDRIRVVTAPGKKDRLRQLLYSQLPYHPQRVISGTVWTVDTTAAMDLMNLPEVETDTPPGTDQAALATSPAGQTTESPTTWTLQAYLTDTLSSAKVHPGQSIQAVVAEPVLDTAGEVAVPQGAVLQGEVTRARVARRLGRAGELRFDFRQLTFPGSAQSQQVQTTLTGVDATGDANLSLDREGKVKPKPKDKVVVPLLLFALASRPLDRDHGDNGFGKDAVASNSLGVIGFLVGTAGGWHNVAAGIGYYGTAISLWNRWIKRGDETVLRRDTRIVIQTTARRSAPLPTGSTSRQ